MPQGRDEAGQLWEYDGIDANGDPINPRPVSAPSRGTVYTPPPKPVERPKPNLPTGWEIGPDGVARPYAGLPSEIVNPKRDTGERPEVTAKIRADALDQFNGARMLNQAQSTMASAYRKGPGQTTGWSGLTDFIPGIASERNQNFNKDAEAGRGMVVEGLGLTGGSVNSMPEAQMWTGPYTPSASDWDSTTRNSIDRLAPLRESAARKSVSVLGGVPDEGGVIHPLGSPRANQILAEIGLSPDLKATPNVWDQPSAGDQPGAKQVATGDKRWVPDDEVNATIYKMYKSGRSHDEIAAYAATRGYTIGPPSAKAMEYWGKRGESPYSNAGRYEDLSLRQQAAATPLAGYASGATNAATLGLSDEIYGAASAALGGDYTKARDQFQGSKRAIADMNPVSDFVGNLTGGIMLPTGAAMAGSRVAPALTSRILNAAASSPVTAATAYGAAYGAGESNDDRLAGGLGGAAGGAMGGMLGKYAVAPVASKIGSSKAGQAAADFAEPLAARVRNVLGGQRVMPAQVSAAENTLAKSMPDIEAVRGRLGEAADMGLPFSLADADPRLRMLGGTVARKSPEARALAENALDPRAMGQVDRLLQGIDDNLAPRVNIEQRGQQLMAAGREEAAPFYEMARNAPAEMDSQIEAYLRTPAGRDALSRAKEFAANEGRDPNTLGFAVDENGEMILDKIPSFETLDLTKRGLDARLNEARNPITGALDLEGNMGLQGVENLRKRFVARMDAMNPDYPQARAAYQKWAQKRDALGAGQALAAPGQLPRQVENALPRLSSNMDEVQRGYATGMGDIAERVRYSGNPYDAVMGTPSAQQKMAAIFPKGAPNMMRRYDLEKEMAKTKYEVTGGSPTAARLAADDALTPAIFEQTGNLMGGITAGAPTAGTAARIGLAGLKFGMGKQAEKKAKDLAPLLFAQNPAQTLKALEEVTARLAQNKAYKKNWQRRGGLFGGASAVPLIVNGSSSY